MRTLRASPLKLFKCFLIVMAEISPQPSLMDGTDTLMKTVTVNRRKVIIERNRCGEIMITVENRI